MARFFIDRPVFAWVIAILIMMAGGISIFRLPVEQYPRIAPPVVTITAKYSGASAQTLEDTVAQVIEQKLNGIDGLLYINSTSDAAGQVSIRLTFDPDTNPDVAQMQVQNKLQLATSSLPEEVTRQGITVTKVADSFLQMYAFVSSDDSMSAADLCDFVGSTILDPLSRVDGVGEVSLFGAPYAMRIWLNPSKLLSYSLTPSDVINAVKAQNKQVSLGEVGGKPIRDGQQMNVTIKAQKQLTSVPEFERILLRVNPDGSAVRLRDVARVELGQESYTSSARYNGKPAAGVGIKLASDANALNTSNAVAAFIEDMRPYFPHGVEVVSPYDTVPFIKISIIEVVKTLLEAIVLVFAVIYLFLQNFRATIIPSLAVPVVLLGTFGVMAAFGFSINTLTMFGMVLAIGLLVDDAIVVVENVARVMEEDGLPPREATIKTMGQITGALIGVAAVLSAVEQHSGGRVSLEDYNGFSRTNPRLALLMTLALFSLAGIPPFAGFFSKFFVFAAAFSGGFHLLVFIALVNTVVSLYYYLLIVKAMYIMPGDAPIAAFRSDRYTRVSLALCMAGVLLLGIVSAVYDGINAFAFGL